MRLIDADVLEIMFKRIGLSPVTNRIVDNVPTVDAVEVVRCKDCKHTKHCGPGKAMCQNGKIHELDWYCADGERRKDKTDGCRST